MQFYYYLVFSNSEKQSFLNIYSQNSQFFCQRRLSEKVENSLFEPVRDKRVHFTLAVRNVE